MAKSIKKTKVVGKEKYINQMTGEILEMDVIEIDEKDANFEKLWLGHIIESLDLVGNQKMKVLTYLLKQKNADNLIVKTQRQMAEETGISYQTVSLTIKGLLESNFLVKANMGAYRINPDVIYKGGRQGRFNVLLKYRDEQKAVAEKPQDINFDRAS